MVDFADDFAGPGDVDGGADFVAGGESGRLLATFGEGFGADVLVPLGFLDLFLAFATAVVSNDGRTRSEAGGMAPRAVREVGSEDRRARGTVKR